MARKALRTLAHSLAEAGSYVVNPSARPRGGVVQLLVPDVYQLYSRLETHSRGRRAEKDDGHPSTHYHAAAQVILERGPDGLEPSRDA